MRKLLISGLFSILTISTFFAQGWVNSNDHYVRPYVRSDGTYVKGHYRTNPNSTNRDNYSTLGNTNLRTGQPGWIMPDNKPLPFFSIASNTWQGFAPSVDYFPDWSTNSNSNSRTSRMLVDIDISNDKSSSYANWNSNASSNNYSTYSYDFSAGERVINYTNGRDEFSVAAPTKIAFKKGLTYYSYDVYLNEINETVGSAEGQLLLNGSYRFYDKTGKLRIFENYKKGLKHGAAVIYNEAGQLMEKNEFTEGRLTYQKFTSEGGVTFEVFGELDKAGTLVMMYQDGGLFRKIEIMGGGRDRRTEFDQSTQKILVEYGIYNEELDGVLRRYQSDGKTLNEVSNYQNGQRNGETRLYHPNGRLREKSYFKEGVANGPFEIYNESGALTRKGRMSNGELHGGIQNFNEDGFLKSKETYVAGTLSGAFALYQKGKPMITGEFRNDQQHGRWNYYWQDSSSYYLAQWLTFENGVKNGPFREIRRDSILVGTYKDGLPDGEFRAYSPMSLWILGIPPKELDENELACTGKYYNGKKNGHWKSYSLTGVLLSEGDYKNDLEHGEWRYYLEKYADFEGKDVEYAGKLFLIENYLNGVKNGRSERLAYLEQIPVMCDTSIGTVNPLDTCFQLRYKKVREVTYHKNGELHGPMEWSDANGNITFKGEYRSGQKFGHWTETYASPEDSTKVFRFEADYKHGLLDGYIQKYDSKTNILLAEGTFSQNKKVGIWREYYLDQQKRVSRLITYSEDQKTSTKVYDSNGNLYLFAQYKNGNLDLLEHYDITKKRIDAKFDNFSINSGIIRFNAMAASDSTIYTHVVWENGFKQIKKDPFDFYETYLIICQISPEMIYQDGQYRLTGKDGKLLTEGVNEKGKKQGEWRDYFYDQNVLRTTQYQANEKVGEQYFKLDSQKTFSGKFTFQTPQEGGYLQIKVKKSLRHGYTFKYDRHGNLVQKTKYKKGKKIEQVK